MQIVGFPMRRLIYKHFSFSFAPFLPFYGSLKMSYQAQLDFYKLHDVYVTSRDVIFAIFQLYGTAAVHQRLSGGINCSSAQYYLQFWILGVLLYQGLLLSHYSLF